MISCASVRVWRFVLALLLGMAVVTTAAIAAPAAPTKEQIAKWVAQLGDNDFAVREQATKKLWEAGQPAEAALQAAAKSDDAEVSRRAKDILEKFKFGIYPDTPQKVADLISRYQTWRRSLTLFPIGEKCRISSHCPKRLP